MKENQYGLSTFVWFHIIIIIYKSRRLHPTCDLCTILDNFRAVIVPWLNVSHIGSVDRVQQGVMCYAHALRIDIGLHTNFPGLLSFASSLNVNEI